MTDIKLTKAQWEWLEIINENVCNTRICVARYQPHVKLCRLGFAEERSAKSRYGYVNSAITPAGRAWLAANPRRRK